MKKSNTLNTNDKKHFVEISSEDIRKAISILDDLKEMLERPLDTIKSESIKSQK